MLQEDLFKQDGVKYRDMVESSFFTLANFQDENNLILKVDNLEETIKNTKHIFRAEEAVQIATILSEEFNKNVFLINEAFNDDLKNTSTSLMDNFYKLYAGLVKVLPRHHQTLNLALLNMQCPLYHQENALAQALYLNSLETLNDVAILRNLSGINIFVPADSLEAEYLLSVVEKDFFKEGKSNFSYFKLSSSNSPKIFREDYFLKEGYLKEWTGIPEIVYLSKNLEARLKLGLIASGPILYNALQAAKELEGLGYQVTVLNVSLVASQSDYLNQKIKAFLNNFCETHKNIITVEEHSKVGGLGSLVSEIVAQSKDEINIKVESLGIEDNLSPRNLIAKAEEIATV